MDDWVYGGPRIDDVVSDVNIPVPASDINAAKILWSQNKRPYDTEGSPGDVCFVGTTPVV